MVCDDADGAGAVPAPPPRLDAYDAFESMRDALPAGMYALEQLEAAAAAAAGLAGGGGPGWGWRAARAQVLAAGGVDCGAAPPAAGARFAVEADDGDGARAYVFIGGSVAGAAVVAVAGGRAVVDYLDWPLPRAPGFGAEAWGVGAYAFTAGVLDRLADFASEVAALDADDP